MAIKDLRRRPCASLKSLILSDLRFQNPLFCAGSVPSVNKINIKKNKINLVLELTLPSICGLIYLC